LEEITSFGLISGGTISALRANLRIDIMGVFTGGGRSTYL
jgi:hypothetical protein